MAEKCSDIASNWGSMIIKGGRISGHFRNVLRGERLVCAQSRAVAFLREGNGVEGNIGTRTRIWGNNI